MRSHIVSLSCFAMFVAHACPPVCAESAATGISVTNSQRVHPVLIRNPHNGVLRVVVDVQRDDEIKLQAIHFTLDGTDDVGDIEALELFANGENQDYAGGATFGEPSAAARTIAFHGEHVLRRGANVFWLSCRLQPSADLLHRVGAVCTAVETSGGAITPPVTATGIGHRIGIALRRRNDDNVNTYRIPALATTSTGTLLSVYDIRRRTGKDLQEDIDIGLSRSTDGGQTWEPVRVIMDMGEYGGLPQEQNGCSDPGIVVDQATGEIFCFAVWMNGKPGMHQWDGEGSEPGFEIGKTAQLLLVRSQDDGLTWSQPENLTRTLKPEAWWLLAPSPQQGINLPDGTLVMPMEGRDAKGKEFSTMMTSTDHGATWVMASPAYSGGSECQVVRLSDGSLMLNMRNAAERFRAVFVTHDLGLTWQPHATNRNTLIEPNCNGSLRRIDYMEDGQEKHVLLFANPHTQQGRTHHTIQVSFDDGRTWPAAHHLLLDEGLGAGYPSLTQIDENHVGIVYEGSQSHLVFERFSLSELLAEKSLTAAGKPFEGPLEAFLGDAELIVQPLFSGERFPNIVVTVDGTLLATWGTSSVRGRRSENGGESWGEEFAIADPGFQGGGTVVDETTGDILAFVEEVHPPAPLTVYRSRDDGQTWQPASVEIHPDSRGNIPSMHMNEHGITLRRGEHRGRLLRPARWYAGKNEKARWPQHYTNAIYSDDGGRTWRTSDPFPEKGTGEATVAELSDGRIYYNSRVHWQVRPQNTRRRSVISTDGGHTWTDWRIVEALPDGPQDTNYGCMGGLVRLPVRDRDILLYSNCDSPSGRQRITVWASFDGGATWPLQRLVYEGPGAYSSLNAGRPATPSEGWIYLHFEGGPDGGSQVARFNLSWVLSGEPTGDGSLPEDFRE